LTKRALAETSVEASPAKVARTIEEIFGIIEIFFKRQNARAMHHVFDGRKKPEKLTKKTSVLQLCYLWNSPYKT
jgi:hypothetical protein